MENNNNQLKKKKKGNGIVLKTTFDIFYILLGIFLAGLGLKGFLLPNKFLDGGVTGISLLLAEITGFNLPLLIFLINIPFVFLGTKHISKEFAVKTISAIGGLSLMIAFFPYPVISSDTLLVSFFGGFFIGMGVGLAIRGGAVLDGTEVLALFVNNRIGLSVGDFIMFLNIIIFAFAAALFGIEIALYGILTYMAASKTVDFVIQGIEEYVGLTIISSKSETVRRLLVQKLKNGVTIYKGKRGMVNQSAGFDQDIDIIFTVVTRLEVTRVINEILAVDANAFIIQDNVTDVKGGMLKLRKPHINHKPHHNQYPEAKNDPQDLTTGWAAPEKKKD